MNATTVSAHPERALAAQALSLLLALALSGAVGCSRLRQAGHGHAHDDHGHGHDDHGHGHGEAAHAPHGEDEEESMAFTLVDAGHELFVEMDVPVAGEVGSAHAHVTRLEDNAPATSGIFGVAYLDPDDPSRVVQSFGVEGVARTGIFTPRGEAPEKPGRYRLAFRYQSGSEVAEWDAGVVEVGEEAVTPPAPTEGEITFLKETSWRLPFRIRKPTVTRIARPVTLPARVASDPRLSATLSAPASGRVLWSAGGEATFEGRPVEEGTVLGRLVPSSSFEGWNALELELRRARIELDRATAELERVDELVADGLLSDKRLVEARAAQQTAEAALGSARREREARSGTASAVEMSSPIHGVVLDLLFEHGATAAAGEAVARVASDEQVLVEGTLRGVAPSALERVHHAIGRSRDPSRSVDLLAAGATLLGPPRAVDPETSGLPVTWSVPNDPESGQLVVGELVELTLGLGTPEEHVTIPLEAVVEINTRPHAFVQVTGESFERRQLVLGPSDGERVAVLEGVSPDDWVVVEGGFDVHVASLAGSVESHRH